MPITSIDSSEFNITLNNTNIFKNKRMFDLVKAYTDTEFSSENIDFLKALSNLNQKVEKNLIRSEEKFNEAIKQILDTYVGDEAPRQINVPGTVAKQLEALKNKNLTDLSGFIPAITDICKLTQNDTIRRLANPSSDAGALFRQKTKKLEEGAQHRINELSTGFFARIRNRSEIRKWEKVRDQHFENIKHLDLIHKAVAPESVQNPSTKINEMDAINASKRLTELNDSNFFVRLVHQSEMHALRKCVNAFSEQQKQQKKIDNVQDTAILNAAGDVLENMQFGVKSSIRSTAATQTAAQEATLNDEQKRIAAAKQQAAVTKSQMDQTGSMLPGIAMSKKQSLQSLCAPTPDSNKQAAAEAKQVETNSSRNPRPRR